ncbi:MAG: hypothetical protein QNK49_00910 [Porticoccus sp.]
MIVKHQSVKTPHGNSTVWRYMSLDKFFEMILSESIYFTNAAKMTDRYEGVVPRKTLRSKKKRLLENGEDPSDVAIHVSHYDYKFSSLRDLTLINCWSLNSVESYALWKIYLSGEKSGVAIKSTVSNLKKSINSGNDPYKEDVYLGKVEYSDYIRDTDMTRFDVITTKNKFYDFEKEMRLFIFHYPLSEDGIKPPYNLSNGRHLKVNIDTLIEKIYLSPFAGAWFEDTFRKMIKNICPELESKIVISDVQDQ